MVALFDKVSELMGLSGGQTKLFLGVCAFAVALGLWFAVDSAVLFYRGFESGGVVEPTARDAGIIEQFNRDVVVVEVDAIVPPGHTTDTGQLVLCGSHMIGDTAERYGWVWDAADDGEDGGGVCRRLAER